MRSPACAHALLGRDRRARDCDAMSRALSGGRTSASQRRAHLLARVLDRDVAKRGRRCLRVASPTDPGHDGAHVDLGKPAARHHLRPSGHRDDPDGHPVPHVLDHVVRQHARRVHVVLGLGPPHGDLLTVDVPDLEVLGERVEERALRRVERAREELVDHLDVCSGGHQVRGGLRVVRRRSRVRQRSGVLVDARAA